MTVEELNIVITAQNREFNQAIGEVIGRLDDLEEQSQRSGDALKDIFKNAAKGVSALGIGKIISDSISNAGDLEQNLGGVEVVFQKHADKLKETALTAAGNMGLSQSAYLATANKMGSLFKGSGFDNASAAEMSKNVMQRAADVASIMGTDVKDAMEAVTGAAKGNFTMMDNLGVAMNDTTLQAYAQEKGLGKLETTQQKVYAAMQMFLDKTEYAAGNYARENDTYSGSLTTLKAEFENLTAELGTQLLPTASSLVAIGRSGLEALAPVITTVAGGINNIAQYLLNLSPGAKTMLGIAVAAALTMPAVTKAQLLYNAANAAWKNLLGILIPKQLTWNSALKATFGWLAIIAGVLALVADVGATAREMSENKSLDDTAEGADNAADSVDGLSESYDGLGNSAEGAEKKLADIDTLNIFKGSSGSTGGIDFNAITNGASEAADAVADAKAQLGDLDDQVNGFDLGGFADTFSTTFSDIGTGFGTIFDAFNFDSDTQLSSLRVLDKKIRNLFGDRWSDFWTNVGSTIYQAFNGHGEEQREALKELGGFLESIDDTVAGWFGDFGKSWSEYWRNIGFDFNESARNEAIELTNRFSRLDTDMSQSLLEHLRNNENPVDALASAKKEAFNSDPLAEDYFNRYGFDQWFNIDYALSLQKNLRESGQIPLEYPDYEIPQSTLSMVAPGLTGTARALTPDETKQMAIELHTTVELDGNIVGESVTNYQEREAMRSNGY